MLTDEKLKQKIDMLCKDNILLEKIKATIKNGVETQYPEIQKLYEAGKALSVEFDKCFTGFYNVRFKSTFNYKALQSIIADGKTIPFADVIARVRTNNNQYSFASKALHTIDNNLPIIDKHILSFFHENRSLESYENIKKLYKNREANGLNKLIDVFNKMYYDRNFSEVKKIDFIIWGYGRVLDEGKKATTKGSKKKNKKTEQRRG